MFENLLSTLPVIPVVGGAQKYSFYDAGGTMGLSAEVVLFRSPNCVIPRPSVPVAG